MNDSSNNEGDGFEPSKDASAEAGFEIELARLSAMLRAHREKGASLQSSISEVDHQLRTSLLNAFEKHRRESLSWWHYWRNPLWVFIYILLRAQLRRQHANWVAVHRMERAWSLAMYGRSLSKDLVERLQIAHRTGILSRWEALSYTRAMCSRVTSEGHWQVEPIGRLGLWLGSAALVTLLLILGLLFAEITNQLVLQCAQGCEVFGAMLGILFVGYWMALVLSATWGRRRVRGAWERIQGVGF
ncbi:hypothetical protein [Polaromonas sp. YR568]|uniref:hypothetical protein n=1 Tax=Polaromonas sp. YR568 TaxID=1855301 RepID=UPI0031379DEA